MMGAKMVIDGRGVYMWNKEHTHAFYRILELPALTSRFYPGITHRNFDGYWSEFTAEHFHAIDGKRIRVTIEVLDDELEPSAAEADIKAEMDGRLAALFQLDTTPEYRMQRGAEIIDDAAGKRWDDSVKRISKKLGELHNKRR